VKHAAMLPNNLSRTKYAKKSICFQIPKIPVLTKRNILLFILKWLLDLLAVIPTR